MVETTKVDISDEALEKQESLSDEQIAAIATKAINDDDKLKKEEQKPEDNKEKPTEEKELPPQETEEDKNVEEETKKQEVESKRTEEVNAIAKELNIAPDEARKELEHIEAIEAKYEGNPRKLAKANLHLQRLQSRDSAELAKLKAQPSPETIQKLTEETVDKIIETGQLKNKGVKLTKDDVIISYREQNPDLTAALDDESVYKLARRELKSIIEKHIEVSSVENRTKLTEAARNRRTELLSGVSEADKEFIPQVKEILEKIPDHAVMQEGFTLADTLQWAQGSKYKELKSDFDKKVKEAEERGFKRGQEEAKILGEKTLPNGKQPISSKKITLTEGQKDRARDMYAGIPEEEAFALFIEFLKGEKK